MQQLLFRRLFNKRLPELILFDLDGTLIDSVPDLAWSIDNMLIELGKPAAGEDNVRNWVGNGVQSLVLRSLYDGMDGDLSEHINQVEFNLAMPIFERLYAQHNAVLTKVYANVRETLEFMQTQPYKLACVTNKSECFTLPLLEGLGLYDFFTMHVCGDTLPYKKPHPLPLLYTAEQLNISPNNCLMVGDSSNDVIAARAAGFKVVCTSYGYNHGEDINLSNPDAVINSFSEFVD